jgi:hypothetical protein
MGIAILLGGFSASGRIEVKRLWFAKGTVGKNVTVKASNFNKAQQFSTNGLQRVQYQPLKTVGKNSLTLSVILDYNSI